MKQQKIAELITENFRLYRESEQLLEQAKQAVEIAIEQSKDKSTLHILKKIRRMEKYRRQNLTS